MIQMPLPSSLVVDARFRRTETMPADRLARVIRSVQDDIVSAQLDRMRQAEGLDLANACHLCGLSMHLDCGRCAA